MFRMARLLILLPGALLCGAAAQVDCVPEPAAPGMVQPVPQDIQGHPIPPPGLAGAVPSAACTPSARADAGSSSLDGMPADVLHGLPGSDLLHPPAPPTPRPVFQ
jgi:hypothetical protein